METELQGVVNYLNNQTRNLGWKASNTIADAQSDLLMFSNVKISFSYRNGNIAAHMIEQQANLVSQVTVSFSTAPIWLCSQLEHNILFCNL